MRIKFLGHAAFFIVSNEGKRIITDPYQSGAYDGQVAYKPIVEECDIVTISHEHADHSYIGRELGAPDVVNTPGVKVVKGIEIKGISTYHDKSQGKERGTNIIFVFNVDGFRMCHLGDLGHVLDDATVKEIGEVDILLIPVGGFFTIDAKDAEEIVNKLNPKITIPMHYKTSACGFPIAPVDDFIKGKPNVKKLGKSEIEITELPSSPEIWVLEPALV